MSRAPHCSVIVPLYAERAGVRSLLDALAMHADPDVEVIPVTRSLAPDVQAWVERAAGLDPRLRPVAQHGQGIADAWRAGLDAAAGNVLATMDGDGVHRLGDALALCTHVAQGADLAIARRYGPGGSGMPGRAARDRLASRVAARAFCWRWQLGVRDPLHGLRARSRTLWRQLEGPLRAVEGNVWMGMETLLAVRRGARVVELACPYGRRLDGRDHKALASQAAHLLWALRPGADRLG